MKNLTIAKINKEINRLAKLERRPTVTGTVVEAYYEQETNRLNIVGEPYTNVCSFGRIRGFLAENLGLSDVHEGNKGYREADGTLIGHFVPGECQQVF